MNRCARCLDGLRHGGGDDYRDRHNGRSAQDGGGNIPFPDFRFEIDARDCLVEDFEADEDEHNPDNTEDRRIKDGLAEILRVPLSGLRE